MPPAKRNPAAGKRPANSATEAKQGVRGYTKGDGTKVRSHTRTAQITRSKEAVIGAGFAGVSSIAIIAEAGFTILSALGIVLIAAFTWLAVIAGEKAAANKKKLGTQRTGARRARATRRKTGTRKTTTRKR